MSSDTFGNVVVVVSRGLIIVIVGGKVVSAVPVPRPAHLLASATGRVARAAAELGEEDAAALAPTAESLFTSLVAQFETEGTASMVLNLDDDDTSFCGTPIHPGGPWQVEPLPIGVPAPIRDLVPTDIPVPCQGLADELANIDPSDFPSPADYRRVHNALLSQLFACWRKYR